MVPASGSQGLEELLALAAMGLVSAPFVGAVAGLWLLARLVSAFRAPELWKAPGTAVLAGLVAASVAGCAYGQGILSGFGNEPDETCALRGVGGDYIRERLFPISEQCVMYGADSGTELVPGWVNPVVVVFTPVAVLAFATAGVLWVRRRRADRRWRGEVEWAEAEAGKWQPVPDGK
ncbi:hypothetical protein ACFC1R_18920 [Kitasatospora sp. NPDC056138]|uniref:hypothetical protein n=1 Tax=Kitasatospora sp. NPDC056138 TaxID=3345724 RepID=UPI0035D91FCE